MSTIKISQLSPIEQLNSNTSNTLLIAVDIPSGTTGKITAKTLAKDLYSFDVLNVGNTAVSLPNTIAQFSASSDQYIQVNLQNRDDNGTADYVVSANTGTDTEYYVDLGFTNSAYDPGSPFNSLGTSAEALDGYLYVQGKSSSSGGNFIIGTSIPGTETRIIAGGVNSENVIASVSSTGINLKTGKKLTFGDSSFQSTAAAPYVQTNTIYAMANTNAATIALANTWLQANDLTTLTSAKSYTDSQITLVSGIDATQNTNISNLTTWLSSNNSLSAGVNASQNTNTTAAGSYANSAFTKANNALANTTGTFAGDLTITGNTIIKTSVRINNPAMTGNNQYLLITGTANNAIGAPSNPGYTIHTAVDGGNRVAIESYGTGTSIYPGVIGRRGRGTAESPSAVQANDIILRVGGNAYGTTKFSQYSDARIEFVASENHTDSSKGTQIQFWTTASGSNTATQIGTMNGNTVTFIGSVSPQKGFIFTPNVNGTILTKTIDFSTDSLVKFDVNHVATITLTNYVAGKVVEVWITNSAAQNKVITHGCLANNSTSKSTTFTIQANSCASLKYFSIDGDNANTYVSITA